MKFPLFSSSPLVGLDIQPHEARFVQLRKTRKGFLIEKAIIVDLPEKIFVGGKIKDWDKLSSVLMQPVREYKLTGLTAAINLPFNLVCVKHIQIPKGISDSAIEDEIRVQLEKDFPGLGDSLRIDFEIINNFAYEYAELFSVATRQEYVSRYIDCINATGLKTKIVDIDVYALKRIYNCASAITSEEIYAIACNIDSVTTLCISTEREIIFHQTFDVHSCEEFLSQLRKRISIFLSAFPNKVIQNLSIYSSDNQLKENMRLYSDWEFDINFINPFTSLSLSPEVNQDIKKEKLLIACGSVMREAPKW